MPKVEAGHRHRGRPTPHPQFRFPTLQAEQHTYEFDRRYQSLRVSWSGGQTFLSKGEARDLHGFLRRIYEPTERSSRSLRLLRRARPQSQDATETASPQAILQRNAGENEASQKPSLEFEAYHGWVNYPTWTVYTVMTSFDETREQLERVATQQPGGLGAVRRIVLGSVEHWKNDKPTPHTEAARSLVQSFLQSGVRRIEWTPVYDSLRGERKVLGEANELTTLAYQLFAKTDWQSIVASAEYLTDADTMLQDWLEAQCFTWVDSPEARAYQGAVGQFANKLLDSYFQAVQWSKVTSELKGE